MRKNSVNALLKFHMHQEFAVLPIVLYVLLSGIIVICLHYYSMKALVLAAVLAILIGFFLCADKAYYWDVTVHSLAQYGNARLIMIFMVIGIFSEFLTVGQIGSGFVWVGMHLHLSGRGFMVFCPLISSLISMDAGTPIAVLLAIMPIFYPTGALMGAGPAILTGAMLGGILFGDALSLSSQIIHTTIASQHDPVTNKGADSLRVMKQRLPYLFIAGILSAVPFHILVTSGSVQNPGLLASICSPRKLWMLLPILPLLIACFRTSNLPVDVTHATVVGIIAGIITGLFRFSDLISVQYETQGLYSTLFDGLSGVVDIIISTILLYDLTAITAEGGTMGKYCNYLTSRKVLQHVDGAEAMISLDVGIVNILLTGCALPPILMLKDVVDTIGKKAGISPERRSILLTAMTANIAVIIPINSAFVMGAATVINQLAANHAYLSVVIPFQTFLSSYYCLLLILICGIWIALDAGREGEYKYSMTYHRAKERGCMEECYNVIVIGERPAGLTVAIYAGRAGRKAFMIEEGGFGGRINDTRGIRSYPGFISDSGTGPMQKFKAHAQSYVTNIFKRTTVTELEATEDDASPVHTKRRGDFIGDSVVLNAGAKPRILDIPNEIELTGHGAAHHATCDAEFFQSKEIYVLGAGDQAIRENGYLTHLAKKVIVVILYERGHPDRNEMAVVEAYANPKVRSVWNTTLQKILGNEEVRGLILENVASGEAQEVRADGVFLFVGMVPQTVFVWNVVACDVKGYILVNEKRETNVSGIYAVGDCTQTFLCQMITTAVGGTIAATAGE